MKNKNEEFKEYYERNRLLVIIVVVIALLIDWLSIKMLIDVNPWGSTVAIPGLTITLQALWLIVNPHAVIYENRFEIKQSLLYNREFYYLDAKAIKTHSSWFVYLVYNDDDLARIPLIGMKAAHKQKFIDALTQKINNSLDNREF